MGILNFSPYKRFVRLKSQLKEVYSIYTALSSDVSNATLTIDSEEHINFSGYNYIDTSGDPKVIKAVIAAIKQYGTSASASRIVSGDKLIHRELETAIARFLNVEASLIFSAGHATNIAAITTLFGKKDLILYDAFIHNSAFLGAHYSGAACLAFAHNDLQDLRELLRSTHGQYRRTLILTEGVFSMDGDIPIERQLRLPVSDNYDCRFAGRIIS